MTKRGDALRAAPNTRRVVVAYVALLVVFGAAISWTSWQAERARELKYLSALAELGEKSLDGYFAQIESALKVLSDDITNGDMVVDDKRAGSVLKRFKQAYPDLQIVAVTRADGQIVATSEAASGRQLPTLAGEPSFILGLAETSKGVPLSVGRAYFGPLTKQWVIPLRYGVRDRQGKVLYLIGAGLPLSRPQTFWKDAPLPDGAALGLIRDDSYMVSRYPVPASVELAAVYGKPLSGGPLPTLFARHEFPASGVVEGQSSVTGRNTVVVFRRLTHYPLTFFVSNPAANLWTAWWQKVQTTYALILLLGAGGVAVYIRSSRRRAAWELERDRRQQELEAVNRELQSFSYALAHDLRAPLRHIDGFVNLWRQHAAAPADERSAHYMEQISAAAIRMGRLVDELIAFAHTARTALNITPVALDALVAEIIDELGPQIAARRVEWVIGKLDPVVADRDLLRLALFNLLENAIKFTRTRVAARIEITCKKANGSATISVSDNGIGFDMLYAHKLFAMFQRLHGEKEFDGTGMGLANVARVAQRHGGRAWAHGEVGRGAAFFFTLPLQGAV